MSGEPSYGGPLNELAGQTVSLIRVDDAYELLWETHLLARLARPDEAIVAETREGRWELRHRSRLVARIDAVDPVSRSVSLTFTRRWLGSGGSIRDAGGRRYRLDRRQRSGDWWLSGAGRAPLLVLRAHGPDRIDIGVQTEAALPAELGLLALLSGYVIALGQMASNLGPRAGTRPYEPL